MAKKIKKPIGVERVAIGIDPSIRGTALAIVRDGKLIGAYAWTETKSLQQKHRDQLVWFANPKQPTDSDRFYRKWLIVDWVYRIVRQFLLAERQLVVAIEDYAYSRSSSSVSDLHELGGMLKEMLWQIGAPFRVYDPSSIKLAWAGAGDASKDDMVEACQEAFDVDYSDLVQAIQRKTKRKKNAPRGRGPGYDLADATCIAFLAYWELLVKLGVWQLSELDSDLRRVLLRTTKANPEALVSRPFVAAAELSDRGPALIRASGEPYE